MNYFTRDFRPRDWTRVFRDFVDPRLAVHIALRDPRSGSILWALGKQLSDYPWLREFSDRFLHYSSRDFEFYERNVVGNNGETWVAWTQLLGDAARFVGQRAVDRTGLGPFERMLHPRNLEVLSERSPEMALAYLQVFRELGGGRFLERYADPEVLKRLFNPRQLVELTELNPEAALAYLQLFRELGDGRFLEHLAEPEVCERLFNPRRVLELAGLNPQAALACLQIVRELGGGEFLERYARHAERELKPGFLERMFHSEDFDGSPIANSLTAAVWIAFARLVDSKYLADVLSQYFVRNLGRYGRMFAALESLPISMLGDLRWFASQTDSAEIKHELSMLMTN